MNKKCVINRLGLSFILSVVFKIGISFVKFNLIINQTLLVVINVICSFIIIIPILKCYTERAVDKHPKIW